MIYTYIDMIVNIYIITMLDYINILFVHFSSMLMYSYFNSLFYWVIPLLAFINLSIGHTLNCKLYNTHDTYTIKEHMGDVSLNVMIAACIGLNYTFIQDIVSYGVILNILYNYVCVKQQFRKMKLNNYYISLTMSIINLLTLVSFNGYRDYVFNNIIICCIQILLSSIYFVGYNN